MSKDNIAEKPMDIEAKELISIDKIDIEILYVLYLKRAVTPVNSLSMKRLLEEFELPKSYYTVLRRIKKKLIPIGYASEGLKNGNSQSFYLTPSGVIYLTENVLNQLEVYEDVEEENYNMEEK